ncbi:MAG: hypothetical protein HKN47_23645 [Pirellulaceae bacterium]|nr:hypothetical protein [Pirellulaceae bacterium]
MSNPKIPTTTKVLFVGLTAVCLPVVLLIAFRPDILISAISGLGVADEETLYEKVNQLFVDILLAYVVSGFMIVADWLCRVRMGKSLINALFINNPNERLPKKFQYYALAATVIGCVIILDFFLMGRDQENWLYVEDGPMESFTALSFAVAGILLIGSVVLEYRKNGQRMRFGRNGLILGVMGGIVLFLVAMEEISWGQRIFGIETPELLEEVNTQQEFNLHNIFTDYFKYAYFIVAIALFGATWKSFLLWLNNARSALKDILPDATLLILAAQILYFSFHLMFNELIEPIAAMFILLFTWQLCRFFRAPMPASSMVAAETEPSSIDAGPTESVDVASDAIG